jgi:hypothetical protein
MNINSIGAGPIAFYTNDSERARIDSSGRLLVGTSTAPTFNASTAPLNIAFGDTHAASFMRYSANEFGPFLGIGKSRSGTIGSQTAVQQNDGLGTIAFLGSNGTDLSNNSASISCFVDGEPFTAGDTTDLPGRLVFSTTADGASSPTERVRITSAGLVGIGTTSPSELLHVAGNARVGANDTSVAELQVGAGATGNRTAVIDLVGDTTYNDFGLRIERSGTGANTTSTIQHRGTGEFRLITNEASPLVFWTQSTERARIDSSGRLLVGTSSTRSVGGNFGGTTNQILFETVDIASFTAVGNKADDSGPLLVLGKSRSGTIGGTTAVIANDTLGAVLFAGANGTDLSNIAARIDCIVDGTPFSAGDTTDLPGRLAFSTTADGAASPTERMRITSAGNVGIGTGSPGTALDVNGSVRVRNGNGFQWIGESGATDTKLWDIYSDNTSANTLFFRCLNDAFSASNAWMSVSRTGASPTSIRWFIGSSEAARIDGSGRLLVGTSSARSTYYNNAATAELQLEGDGEFSVTRNANDVFGGSVILAKTRSSGNTIVSNGDIIGNVSFQGNDGSDFNEAANIKAEVDGTPGTNDMPGRLTFSTTADGASSPTERMRISQNGIIRTFSSDGSFYPSTSQGAGTAYAFIYGRHTATDVDSGTNSFVVWSNGNVVNTNNSYGAISDIKLKENIVDANSQWDDLKALQVRNYNFKEGQTHTQIGLVAQEVELISPGLVSESPDRDEDGNHLGTVTKSVNYSVLYMKAVKALQEAMERIEVLEQRLTDAGIA